MSARFQQTYKQIFEIKIKQDRLCSFLEAFNIKINRLEENQKTLQSHISMSNILDEVRVYVRALIKEENTQMIYKFYEKIDNCSRDVNRVEYSFKNFQKCMKIDFENILEKEKLLQKTVSYLNSHEILRLQQQIESLTAQIDENKSEFKEEIEVERTKIDEVRNRINTLKEELESGEEKLEDLEENLSVINKKISLYKEGSSSKLEFDKEKDKNHPNIQQQRLIGKKAVMARRSIDYSQFPRSFDQVKQKETQEGKIKQLKQSENKKIQSMEKKTSVFYQSGHHQNQRESSLIRNQSLKNMDRGNKSIALRKSTVGNRKSIEQSEGVGIEEYNRLQFATNNNANDIRRINQKLATMTYKNTLLEENYEAILNRISRLGSLEAQIDLKIEQAERIRVDADTVNEIKLRFKQIQTAMELEEVKYINKITYLKQIEEIYSKIKQIDSTLPKLARKQEVISAFTFIENKIKEIVTVLSDKFEEDKMGAINKIQNIKCLSCDRENNLTDMTYPNNTDLTRPNTKLNIRATQKLKGAGKRVRTQQNQ